MKKNLLAALLFPLCLLGKPAIAEEIQPKPAIELSLEKRLSKPSISIIFDSGIETEQEETAYENSFAGFYSGYIWTSQNIPPAEKLELSKIMNSIKNGGIDSYRSLVESLKNSSENQKLLLLAIISNSLYAGSYDSALLVNGTKVASQEDFFDKLQDFLATNNPNSLGVCRHFASHIEQLANDVGLRAAAVTGTTMGGGHAYNVLKTENGTAIIDGGHILIADTKNIEKILEAYQKDANSIAFQHLFFEDSKFKYRLITKDGRNFLEFVGYDESLETLKNSLLQNSKSQTDLSRITTNKSYITSTELDFFGFFTKIGEIRGNLNSPLDEMELIQLGYKKDFSFSKFIVSPSFSLIAETSEKELDENRLYGATAGLILALNNKQGLNLSSRINGNITFAKEKDFFHDLAFETGASYKIPIKNLVLEPYLLAQLSFLPEDLGEYLIMPIFNDFETGVKLDISLPYNSAISINPHYSYRPYEYEIGLDLGLKGKNLGVDANGYLTKPTYDFNPDKLGIDLGVSAFLGSLGIRFSYKDELQNYSGEIDTNPKFSVQGRLNF